MSNQDSPEPKDDAVGRELRNQFGGPRARLNAEARELVDKGDLELKRAYHRWLAAADELDDAKAAAEEARKVEDFSYFELNAAMLAESAAYMATAAAEFAMLAIVARRHRMAEDHTDFVVVPRAYR